MKFKKLKIKGVYLISPKPFKDSRGLFRRHFCLSEFNQYNIDIDLVLIEYNQSNIALDEV